MAHFNYRIFSLLLFPNFFMFWLTLGYCDAGRFFPGIYVPKEVYYVKLAYAGSVADCIVLFEL